MKIVFTLLVGVFCMTVSSRTLRCETHRLAVIVGNNTGTSERPSLHFAEWDARRVAAVFTELGGFKPDNVHLLVGRSPRELDASLQVLAKKVSGLREERPGDQFVLLFYYSGHSDGMALEMKNERVLFSSVRARLNAMGEGVRLVIVDSCRSGKLLNAKGGTLGPVFDVRLADNLSSTGEAMITSNAASEVALESKNIQASFFSHYFVSGLRGAADSSGDGTVSLAEAYQYAFTRTVMATADTTIGPQHPGYDYQLTGRGDVVLTQVSRATGRLNVPTKYDRVLIQQQGEGQSLFVELGRGDAGQVAIPPGTYQVRAWQGGKALGSRVRIRANEPMTLVEADFGPIELQSHMTKGSESRSSDAKNLFIGLGVSGGASGDDVWLTGLRFGHTFGEHGIASMAAATGSGNGFRETQIIARGGPVWKTNGPLRVVVGAELGGGVAIQSVDDDRTLWSGIGTIVPSLGLEWGGTTGPVISLITEMALSIVRKDEKTLGIFRPGLWLVAGF